MRPIERAEPTANGFLSRQIVTLSSPLENVEDLNPLLERIGDARYVLLGEASHGTRSTTPGGPDQPAADRREGLPLHRRRGRLARLLPRQPLRQGLPDAGTAPRGAARLRPLADLDVGQLRRSSSWPSGSAATTTAGPRTRRSASTAWTSTACGSRSYAIMGYLQPRRSRRRCAAAWRAFRCFEPYGEDVQEYARATRFVPDSCEDEVVALLHAIRNAWRKTPRGTR